MSSTGCDASRELPSRLTLEFPFQDVHDATGGFSPSKRLGSASSVYRGILQKTDVAVKAVTDCENFAEEVRILTGVRHPNVVRLLGWSQHLGEKFFIYELQKGSEDLHCYLEAQRARESSKSLEFPSARRRQVALDVAEGLCFLAQKALHHRDIKPSNILLDSKAAKLADFASGRLKDLQKAHLPGRISGTPGYACPIYIQTGQASEQTEVYSYGTVLLELIVNRPPALMDREGGLIYPLLQCIQPAAPGALSRIQKYAESEWRKEELEDLGTLALRCVNFDPERRPLFQEIVAVMRGADPHGPAPAQGTGVRSLEMVLSCVWDERTKEMERKQRKIVLKDLEAPVGRQHQPDFFECFVKKESLEKISRTHFKIFLSPSGPTICKHSANPLWMDGVPLQQGTVAAIRDKATLTFGSLSDPALVLQASYVEGARPRGTAILECVKSICTDVKRIPEEARRIAVSSSIEVGRQHQVALFDKLLQANPSWLSFNSRTHLKVCLACQCLQVENLSTNPVMVNGRQLRKCEKGKIHPGGCLAFLAKSEDQETAFLEFSLHMADAKAT